jgi:2-amino-4-hydroxy-6-hydroxymethyldihydropteridine diphosphokinase
LARVYISLGSNIDAPRHLRAAVAALRECYGELILSPVYESEAVGFEGDNFLNLVAGLETDQDVHEVNRQLHAIEDAHGRQRNGPRFSPRTLDLDLLLYDDLILSEDKLQLPRDEITRNAFVLRPLADIAPDLRHPVTGQTMAELWQAFDKTSQRLWPIAFEW